MDMGPDQLSQLVERPLNPSKVLSHPHMILLEILDQHLVQQISFIFEIFVD